jgi:hypothetical protein
VKRFLVSPININKKSENNWFSDFFITIDEAAYSCYTISDFATLLFQFFNLVDTCFGMDEREEASLVVSRLAWYQQPLNF